jgi:16S rRNA processing protein RimM
VAPDEQSSFIAIARIARTRGNRGEVLADLYTDFPDRFNQLEKVWLASSDGSRRQWIDLEEFWEHKGRLVLKFRGVDDISSAEAFAGWWVEIPANQAVRLPEGTYFDHDLIGCEVENTSGQRVGVVTELLHFAGNNQLVVKNADREFLIPAVESICVRISVEEKRIQIDPPEGLLDLDK